MSGYQAGQGTEACRGHWLTTVGVNLTTVGATNPSQGWGRWGSGDAQAFPEAKPAPGPRPADPSVYARPSCPCILGRKPPQLKTSTLIAWQEGARLWQQAHIRTLYKDKLVMTLGWERSGERKESSSFQSDLLGFWYPSSILIVKDIKACR